MTVDACEVPAALGGPAGLAVTRRVVRRKQKSRSSWWNCSPGTSSAVPLLPVRCARDLRPHPPHGGAASAYTCSRRLGCESRSGNGRPGSSTSSTVVAETQPRARLRRGGYGYGAMTAIPATFRAYVAEKVDGSDRGRVERGVRAVRARRTCRPARSRSGSPGRASTTRTGWRRGSDGKVARISPLIPGIDLAGDGRLERRRRDPGRDGRCSPTATTWASSRHGGFAEYQRVPADWVVPLAPGLSPRDAMAIGTAGFTAAMSVVALEDRGLSPDDGPVLVTGALGRGRRHGAGDPRRPRLRGLGRDRQARRGGPPPDDGRGRDPDTGRGDRRRASRSNRNGGPVPSTRSAPRRCRTCCGRCRTGAAVAASRQRRRRRARRRRSSRSSCAASRCSGWIR